MLHSWELVFAVVIVSVPTARLRLFARLRQRFTRWRLGHRSTPLVGIAVRLGLFPSAKSFGSGKPSGREVNIRESYRSLPNDEKLFPDVLH